MATVTEKRIQIQHFAAFRDARGCEAEVVTTQAATPRDLYDELDLSEVYPSAPSWIRVAVNDEFTSWNSTLRDGDTVVFIAPVAGG